MKYDYLMRLGDVLPAAIRGIRVDCCILATRIGVRALEIVGVPARPLTVRVIVYNGPLFKRMQAGMVPADTAELVRWGDEDGSYSLGLGFGENDSKWAGHLVIVSGDRMLDPTIPQANRPHWGIRVEPLVAEAPASFLEGRQRLVLTTNGVVLKYQAWPDDESYKFYPDWTCDTEAYARHVAANL